MAGLVTLFIESTEELSEEVYQYGGVFFFINGQFIISLFTDVVGALGAKVAVKAM